VVVSNLAGVIAGHAEEKQRPQRLENVDLKRRVIWGPSAGGAKAKV